jgi:hypothetical protein
MLGKGETRVFTKELVEMTIMRVEGVWGPEAMFIVYLYKEQFDASKWKKRTTSSRYAPCELGYICTTSWLYNKYQECKLERS